MPRRRPDDVRSIRLELQEFERQRLIEIQYMRAAGGLISSILTADRVVLGLMGAFLGWQLVKNTEQAEDLKSELDAAVEAGASGDVSGAMAAAWRFMQRMPGPPTLADITQFAESKNIWDLVFG